MAETKEVRASLGCGTLILIAIIVLVFGGHSDHKRIENQIADLKKEVQQLREELKGNEPENAEEAEDNQP